jgi:hypothetical protein
MINFNTMRIQGDEFFIEGLVGRIPLQKLLTNPGSSQFFRAVQPYSWHLPKKNY